MTERSSKELEDERLYNTLEKWYVRKKWLEHAIKRKEKNRATFIKYLTLTCSQAYDVRFFDKCELISSIETSPKQKQYMDVAFCEKDLHRHSLIKDKLAGALSHHGRFEDFVGAGRVGFSDKVDKWFPFDVVNLDINAAPFKQNSRLMLDTSSAVRKLFIIQKLKQKSFTLFLTVCSVEEGNSEENKKKLGGLLDGNLKSDNTFRSTFLKKYPRRKVGGYHEFLLIVVPKLVVENGFSEGFDVRCLEKMTYVGGQLKTRMVALIFDCEFKGSIDMLAKIRKHRMLEIVEGSSEDVNERFDQDQNLVKDIEALRKEYG